MKPLKQWLRDRRLASSCDILVGTRAGDSTLACAKVGTLADQRALPHLLRFISERARAETEFLAAMEALSAINPGWAEASDAHAALEQLFLVSDQFKNVRRLFLQLGTAVAELLVARLHGNHSYWAGNFLSALGSPAIPYLQRAFVNAEETNDRQAKGYIATVLARLHDPAVVPELQRAIEDDALRLADRANAAHGLRKLAKQFARPLSTTVEALIEEIITTNQTDERRRAEVRRIESRRTCEHQWDTKYDPGYVRHVCLRCGKTELD